ncbi:CoA-binding protein [Desulfobotulus sp. H1]|uniref:CoA-binding protein n=1 Tax=Desulfobotulus pelophilus TaxID=2823377 RepID=A0ABT3N714_9BACT|nr:CoA-binding protein [Desulfobotulus pelophilus]MCW7753249.1 CoA-binding protein [Desulfobotulus pelophilus]
MRKGRILEQDADIRKALQETKSIAVLGMSPRAERDSNKVGRYLLDAGYEVIPVNPAGGEILGLAVEETIEDLVKGSVDILDIFRKSEDVAGHVDAAIALQPRVVWMQLGVENGEAAARLTEAGMDVIMDKCIKVEHARLCR